MRSAVSFLVLAAAAHGAGLPYFAMLSDDAGGWPAIFTSVGFQPAPAAVSRIFIARTGSAASGEWNARIANGAVLVLEGESSLAEMLGFHREMENVKVASVADVHNPGLRIVWETALELPRFQLPAGARVFARERWSGAPLIAGFQRGAGAVLWVAVSPGERGHERFPYLLHALEDLGVDPPFRSSRLWAFFDSSYRSRVDIKYFAKRWSRAGIAALHVAAWHFYDGDAQQDQYLERLIDACHREGILVYAWLELPHVSEKFWADHPEWREQTAVLQDAHLDWRKLMNLANRDCARAVSAGVRRLVRQFDWDGVNLAELYFESLEGIANPSRFTPMNADVRAEFRHAHGFDPLELFRKAGVSARPFLDYRADLARRMQEQWLAELEAIRVEMPHLDLVLTHVDDRFDTGMRDAIGADAERILPLLDKHNFTFLVEDPATVWHLGPQRYRTIAERYRALTKRRDRLAIDLNIVERYQNVYPTRQQTGTELFQLVHYAAASFPRVALYGENSLMPVDTALLASAAAAVSRIEQTGAATVVDSPAGFGLPWRGGAKVDGIPWPAFDDSALWLPAGPHTVERTSGSSSSAPRLLRLNADLRAARVVDSATIEFSYQSAARALAVTDDVPHSVEVDGVALAGPLSRTLALPRGQHLVTIRNANNRR